ncbi:hypothetical protein BBJ29_009364 [Phytophthora kernoviae]|uniref:Uncharacterized protein n=1 Tax=Phytophthora kernoviae TaxID=325452 RepID=A0A3F2RCA1_9STRA|nr:hypothetical protein BBP00_00009583 [Phytophthora kernoviae]RLN58638.1 hypothetical protein BBJ29_009364 [Phytophthora kernoviae]
MIRPVTTTSAVVVEKKASKKKRKKNGGAAKLVSKEKKVRKKKVKTLEEIAEEDTFAKELFKFGPNYSPDVLIGIDPGMWSLVTVVSDCAKMKAVDTLAKRLVPKTSKQVCIAYGDWSRRTGIKGHASGPVKGFVKALKMRATVIPMNEYRTSITCSYCHQRLKQARLFTKMKRKDDEFVAWHLVNMYNSLTIQKLTYRGIFVNEVQARNDFRERQILQATSKVSFHRELCVSKNIGLRVLSQTEGTFGICYTYLVCTPHKVKDFCVCNKTASPEIPYSVGHDQHGMAVQQGSEGKNDQVVDYTNEKFNKEAFTNAIVFVTIGVF